MYHNIMGVKIEYETCYILYTGKIFARVIFTLVVRSKFNMYWANSSVVSFLSLNTTMAGRIYNGVKLFASVDRHRAKITMLQYTMI